MANLERFRQDFAALAEIGWNSEKGLERDAYGCNWQKAVDFLGRRMREAGMSVRQDSVGNLFGRYEGRKNGLKTILSGSHPDAAPGGGVYDGALGVICALESARSIHESPGHDHPLEVVAFAAEEGGDLGGTFGSRAFAGLHQKEMLPREHFLDAAGLTWEKILAAKGKMQDYLGFLELHIEQGPVLWRKKIDIGIPLGIVGITRYLVTLEGAANHAGSTPMKERRDAMREAAFLLAKWYEWISEKDNFVCNVGVFELKPGGVAVVPGKVSFILELRSLDEKVTSAAAEQFRSFLLTVATCRAEMRLLIRKEAVLLDDRMQECVLRACADANVSCLRMPSGASHDAAAMANVMPTGMIFVPSEEGVSHSREEQTSFEEMSRGLAVLERAMILLDAGLNAD